jgi:short-subunit dehydrogenase
MNKYKENHMINNFDKTILYESRLYDRNRYQTIREKIRKDEIKITGLIGNNGIIDNKEFESCNIDCNKKFTLEIIWNITI